MSAHKGLIFLKKKDKLVSDTFLTSALKMFPSGLGYAVHQGTKPGITMERGSGTYDLETLKVVQAAGKEADIIFMLMKGEFKPDDLQPFTMLGTEEQPRLVGFAEGDFINFIPKDGAGYSNEFFMFNKYLTPKLKRMLDKECGGDLVKLFNELNDPIIQQELKGQAGDSRGCLVLLSETGRIHCVESNNLHREFDWGWTTNHLGHEEKAPVVETPADDEEVWKPKLKSKPVASGQPPIIASVKSIPQPAKTSAAIPADAGTEHVKVDPPPRGMSKGKQKEYWNKVLGFLPKDWKDFPTHYSKKKQKVLKDLKELATADVKTVEPSVTAEIQPIMSPKVIEAVQEEFGKDDDEQKDDPEKLREIEEKFASFEEATGIDMNVTDAWRNRTKLNLAQKYPMAMVILLNDYIARAVIAEQLKKDVEDDVGKDSTDTSGTGTVNEEEELYVPKSKRKAVM